MPFRIYFTDFENGIQLTACGDEEFVFRLLPGHTLEQVSGAVLLLIEQCDMPAALGMIFMAVCRKYLETSPVGRTGHTQGRFVPRAWGER